MRVVSDTTRWYRPAHLLLGLLVVEVIVLHSVSVQYIPYLILAAVMPSRASFIVCIYTFHSGTAESSNSCAVSVSLAG